MNNDRGIDPYNNRYRLNIVHLYPDLLNLYGDRGNIQCMRMRCRWRGIDAQVTECNLDDPLSLASADIVLLGGGSDREQQIVCTRLQKIRQDLRAYVEDGGSMLAVCGGYQLLGHYYDTPEGRMEVLSLVDLYTEQGSPLQTSTFPLRANGCTVKAQKSVPGIQDPAVIRSPRNCSREHLLHPFGIRLSAAISQNRTHFLPPLTNLVTRVSFCN